MFCQGCNWNAILVIYQTQDYLDQDNLVQRDKMGEGIACVKQIT